jgi:hypothetical protein
MVDGTADFIRLRRYGIKDFGSMAAIHSGYTGKGRKHGDR